MNGESPTVARKNDALRLADRPPCAEADHNWTPWIGSERCTRCTYHRNVPEKDRDAWTDDAIGNRTRDGWRRSLVEQHTPCRDRACRWPDVACTGGTSSAALKFEHDREAVRAMRKPIGFAE
jgi:hypothetical protein